MNDRDTQLQELKNIAKKFVTERNWQEYHDAKSMSMNIACEAAELMELVMWIKNNNTEELEKKRKSIEHEVADVFFALLDFCNTLNIDITSVFLEKMVLNAKKYPVPEK